MPYAAAAAARLFTDCWAVFHVFHLCFAPRLMISKDIDSVTPAHLPHTHTPTQVLRSRDFVIQYIHASVPFLVCSLSNFRCIQLSSFPSSWVVAFSGPSPSSGQGPLVSCSPVPQIELYVGTKKVSTGAKKVCGPACVLPPEKNRHAQQQAALEETEF